MNNGYNQLQNMYTNPYTRVNPNGIIWVQGIEGAKGYQLMPNTNVVLMDSENDKFYIKSADNVGMCTLKSFTYSQEVEAPKEEYVTKSEFKELLDEMRALNEQIISRNGKSETTKSVQQSTSK